MFPLAQLVKDHPALVSKLSRYSFFATAPLVSGLSLLPDFHGNTALIEALQHLVAMSCKGRANPQRDDLAVWLKLLNESPLRSMEDPIEDVFVGYVNSAFGGFRVFRGIFAEGDFWLERLLAFLEEKLDFPGFRDGIECALPLLKLSEAIVKRVSLPRYCAGSGMAASQLKVPQWRILYPCFTAVHFSDFDLVELEINRDHLLHFVLSDEERLKLAGQTIWNSSLERYPLIAVPSGITVISPSNIIRAATRLLLERILQSGIGGWGDMFFHSEISSVFVNDVATRLQIKPLNCKLPVWPDGVPAMMPFLGYFDYGKPVLMLNHCIPLSQCATDFNGFESFNEDIQGFSWLTRVSLGKN